MASEPPRKGLQVPPEGAERHQHSRSESEQGDATSQSRFHSKSVFMHIDLTAEVNNSSRKHAANNDPHDEHSHKRSKLDDDTATMPGPTNTSSATASNEIMHLTGENEHLNATSNEKMLEQERMSPQLGIEQQAHNGTESALEADLKDAQEKEMTIQEAKSIASALRRLFNRSQENLKSKCEEILKLEARTSNQLKDLVSTQDEDNRFQSARIKNLVAALSTQDKKIKAQSLLLATQLEESERNKILIIHERKRLDAVHRELIQEKKDSATRTTELEAAKTQAENAKNKREKTQKLHDAMQIVSDDQATRFTKGETSKKLAQKRLTELNKEMKAARTAHEQEKAKLTGELEEQQVWNKTLQAQLRVLRVEKESWAHTQKALLASQKTNGEEKVKLTGQVVEEQAKNEELRAEKKSLEAEFRTNEESWNDTHNDLLQQLRDSIGLSQRHNFTFFDVEVREVYGNLTHKMRQFVDRHARPVASPDHLTACWNRLSPMIAQLLASPMDYCHAFEAYMWECLDVVVFVRDSSVWAGEAGRAMQAVLSAAEAKLGGKDDETDYHGMRASSSILLSRLFQMDFNEETYRPRINAWIGDLSKLMGPDFNTTTAAKDLKNIIIDARAFDIMRRKAKSKILICFGGGTDDGKRLAHSTPVDDSFMHRLPSVDPLSTSQLETVVSLVVSPAIIRWGESNGTDYDKKTCLVKMNVLVSPVAADFRTAHQDVRHGTPAGGPTTPLMIKADDSMEEVKRETRSPPVRVKTEPGVDSAEQDTRFGGAGQSTQQLQPTSPGLGSIKRTRNPRGASKNTRRSYVLVSEDEDVDEGELNSGT